MERMESSSVTSLESSSWLVFREGEKVEGISLEEIIVGHVLDDVVHDALEEP
jgi:hypothetical protein